MGVVLMCAVACTESPEGSSFTGASGVDLRAMPTVPTGFGTASVRIRRADGSLCVLCTFVARSAAERQQGLMGVTDLAGHDGMLFVFDGREPQRFWMRNTPLPLSAAWFGADGSFSAAFDMDPCLPEADDCQRYGPDRPVLHVLEVPRGNLDRLGIGPGARLAEVGGPCAPSGSDPARA